MRKLHVSVGLLTHGSQVFSSDIVEKIVHLASCWHVHKCLQNAWYFVS